MNLATLKAIASSLDEKAFVARFTEPMLVLRKKGGSANAPIGPSLDWRVRTQPGPATGFQTTTQSPDERSALFKLTAVELLVKSTRNPFGDMITVGRAPNNDVVLAISSVSKLHAYFRKDQGKWFIRDERSTHGTYLNGARLKAEQAIIVPDGAQILFGPDAECLFKLPASMHGFLKLLPGV